MLVRVRSDVFALVSDCPMALRRELPANDVTTNKWELYERDKRALRRDLGPREYEIAVAELARELGL